MLRFYTISYALLADLALACLLVAGVSVAAVAALPALLVWLSLASLGFVLYANFLMLSGRRFSKSEAIGATLVGAGLPLIVIGLLLLIVISAGIDILG